MIYSNSSFDIISGVDTDPKIDDAAINPNRIKIFLANALITTFVNDNPVFSNESQSLPRNHPNCIILIIKFLIALYQLISS